MPEPTKRQIEALRSIYLGRSIYDRRDRPDLGRSYSSSMGGAVKLMQARMGEAGWLEYHETRSGRGYWTQKLTSEGLLALRAHHPELEGIDARIAEARDKESAARIAEAEEAKKEEAARIARAEARRAARAAAMREIAQSYQISLDALSDDQCRAMWMEIIDREHQL